MSSDRISSSDKQGGHINRKRMAQVYDAKLFNEILMYFMDRRSDGEAADISEVYENLFVGNEVIARDAVKLRDKGINLVINLSPNEVKTNPSIYQPYGINYYPVDSGDNVFTCLVDVVDVVVEIIEKAIQDGGNVLIHCSGGTRKSPAMAIAYLMLKKQMSIWSAVKRVRRCRKICPSNGLIMQLCCLNKELYQGAVATQK